MEAALPGERFYQRSTKQKTKWMEESKSQERKKRKKIRDKKGGNQIQGLYLRLERLAEGER